MPVVFSNNSLNGGQLIINVNVHLKPDILDPQSRAVLGALERLGITEIAQVRQGKQFTLSVKGEMTEAKLERIRQVAGTLLSNPVIEDFTIEVLK